MKIRTVCEKTGLTDRTIRYYIEEELIHPSFTENYLGRRQYDFSEDDIVALCDIAVLRSFDFSIEEIRELLSHPENSPVIIRAVRDRIGDELGKNQKKIAAFSLLREEMVYTVSELAEELSRPEELAPTEETVGKNPRRRLLLVLKGGTLFAGVWLPLVIGVSLIAVGFFRYEHPIVDPLFLALTLILFIPSLLYLFSSRIKPFRQGATPKVLLLLCLVCIPCSALVSFFAVTECGHRWVVVSLEGAADCGQLGRMVQSCAICRDIAIKTVEGPPHTVVIDSAREATCSEEGLSEGKHCSVCQTVLVRQEILPKKKHSCVKSYVMPTCDKEGYTLWTCSCGYRYRTNVIAATENHNFQKNENRGYICSFCTLEVCEYGFADGSLRGEASGMKYYITGGDDGINAQERTLVIYGNGAMPAPILYGASHPWRNSLYVEEIRTVIIGPNVTSLAKNAFTGGMAEDNYFGNPFHAVERFIVRSKTLTVAPESPDVSGIECDITYER